MVFLHFVSVLCFENYLAFCPHFMLVLVGLVQVCLLALSGPCFLRCFEGAAKFESFTSGSLWLVFVYHHAPVSTKKKKKRFIKFVWNFQLKNIYTKLH